MTPWSPEAILLIVCGTGVLLSGLRVLWWMNPRRRPAEQDGDAGADQAETAPGFASEPTRLVTGLVLLVIGYHFVMWGLPPDWVSDFHVSRGRWYLVVCGSGALLASSWLLDRWEAERDRGR